MENLTLLIIIFALSAIIPAGVVFVALWSRIISQKADIDGAKEASSGILSIKDRLTAVENNQTSLKFGFGELEESLGRLNSKWAARDKHEQAKEKKEKEAAEPPPLPAEPEKRYEQLTFPFDNRGNTPVIINNGRRYKLKQGG